MEEFISQEDMPLNEGISDSTIQELNNLDLSNEKDKQIAELSKRGYQLLKENNFEGAKESFQSILIQDENNNYALVGLGDTMRKENDIQQAVRSLVGKVQAIYVPTDNVLASAMPTLVSVTEEAKLPVICGEGGMVKAGGLATLGVDYYKLGFQAGEMAADILSGKSKPADMAIQAQKEFKAMVNLKEAEKIGLKVPEDVLKGAELVK